MSAADDLRDAVELRSAGMDALTTALGYDGAAAFLAQCAADTPGWNFTTWLKERPKRSNAEVQADIIRFQQERKQGAISPSPTATP